MTHKYCRSVGISSFVFPSATCLQILRILPLFMLILSSAVALTQAPTLTSISPTSVLPGTQVTLTGSGFGATQTARGGVIFNNGAAASIVSWSDTQVVATVAPVTLGGRAYVSQNGVRSNGIVFTMIPPTLSSISPTSVLPGTQVTFTGSGFGATQTVLGGVIFNNGAAASIVSWSDTQVVATVAPVTFGGRAYVSQNGVRSNGIVFTMIPPTLSSISPTSVLPGTQVTFTGSGFGATQTVLGGVTFNNEAAASIVSWSDTQVVATVAAGTARGLAYVSQNQVRSNGLSFSISPNPAITSLAPTTGAVGSSVTINGTNFGTTQDNSTVAFNGIVVPSIANWSGTSITATVPTGATAGNVVVTLGSVASNGVPFTVAPNIISMSPTSGAIGTSVTITGTSFGSSQGTVTFNGTSAIPTSWGAGSIIVPVPAGGTSGNVIVTAGGVPSVGVPFTVSPTPTISGLNPSSAAAGTVVQVTGQNLSSAGQQTVVNIGNLQIGGNQVNSSSPTSVNFLIPTGAASGALTIQVGQQSSNSLAFSVLTPPQIYTLSPLEVAPSGVLTISGIYFGANGASGNSLLIDGQAAGVSSWSNTQITVQVPSTSGAHTVAVVAGGNQSASLPFTVLSYGSISGTVTSSGAAVPSATVQGAAGQSAVSDSGGSFSFPSVPVGIYSLGAVATGYVPSVVSSVTVVDGANTSVQVQISLPNPTQISIVPNGPTVTTGAGLNLSLVDQNGMPVTGANWSVDDSAIAFIDPTDNSVMGLSAGVTTVRAAWQGYQASTSVSVVAAANVLWSSQVNSQQLGAVLPLAKTGTGPDFVYTDGSNLYGMSYDTGVVWQQSLPGLPNSSYTFSQAAADENGDFVIPGSDPTNSYASITKFYGSNGLPQWTHNSIWFSPQPDFAVNSLGDVYIVTQGPNSVWSLQKLDSATGQATLSYTLSQQNAYALPSQVYILPDDSVQLQYEDSNLGVSIVHLATLSPNSVTDVVLDSTVFPQVGSATFARADANLPDGNGGTVTIWEEDTDYTQQGEGTTMVSGTIFFSDSTTGVTSQSSGINPNKFVLGSTGLLYFVSSQVGCSSSNGYCGDNLVAMNLAAGTEAWRIKLDSTGFSGGWTGQQYGMPVAATADGGLMVTAYNSEILAPGAARIDTSGNVIQDSDLSPYVLGSNAFPSTLTYLGGPDGTLWASYTSNSIVSDLVDEDTTDGDTVSDFMTPSGKGNAFRAEINAHFKDASANLCGGFDGKPGPGKHAPSILVVPRNGSNQVILKIKGAWQNYTIVSDTSTVTFAPSAPTGKSTTLTISGGSSPTLARIKVYDANGHRQATLRVAVKPLQNVSLDLYPVTEANENIAPQSVPNSTDVLSQLNGSLAKEANMNFTVNPGVGVSAVYDLAQPPSMALMNPLSDIGLSNREQASIILAISGAHGNSQDKWMAYVHAILPILGRNDLEGFVPFPGASVGFMADPVPGYVSSGQPHVTAHETGHLVGLPDRNSDQLDLMIKTDPGTSPCRIHANEWNILNPTGTLTNPAQWELAPPQPQDQ